MCAIVTRKQRLEIIISNNVDNKSLRTHYLRTNTRTFITLIVNIMTIIDELQSVIVHTIRKLVHDLCLI